MSPFRRGKVWWASIPLPGGGRERVSLETTSKPEAVTREAERRNQAERERLGLEVRTKNPRHLTLAKATERHLARTKHQKQHGRLSLTLTRHIVEDEIGALPIEKVTPGVIAAWLDRKQAQTKPLSATTCNRLRANLSAIFTGLIEREDFLGENPVRRVRQRKQKQPKSRLLPAEVVLPLIEHAPTTGWQLAFALAAFAGLRRGEIERLAWDDVDLAARLLVVRESKTGVSRTVAVHKELASMLREAEGTGLVVARAGWTKSAEIVRNALKRGEIKVPGTVQACFHSLRHAWATRLIDCGADPFIVQLMGWGPPKGNVMATNYARPRAALIEAIDRLCWPTGEVIDIKSESQSRHRGGA